MAGRMCSRRARRSLVSLLNKLLMNLEEGGYEIVGHGYRKASHVGFGGTISQELSPSLFLLP